MRLVSRSCVAIGEPGGWNFGGTGERVAVYQAGDAGVVSGAGSDRRLPGELRAASRERAGDARPPRLAHASRAWSRRTRSAITMAFAFVVGRVRGRTRATASSRAARCLLFLLTLPMWLAAREAPGALRARRGACRPLDRRRVRRRRHHRHARHVVLPGSCRGGPGWRRRSSDASSPSGCWRSLS